MSVDVVTFGCRLNAYEGEVIRRQAQGAGLADAVIVNTCAVTEEAVRQSRQAIRSLKRQHPGAPIVVTGCAAQVAPESFAQMAEVALVLGNEEKGMRRLTEEACDVVCQVPPRGGVTSLNVAVAAGVLISRLTPNPGP